MKTSNKIIIGLLSFVLVLVIATSGYMVGYASGHDELATSTAIIAQPNAPSAPAAQPPASSAGQQATSGAVDTSAPPSDQESFKIFWEAYQVLQNEYYGDDLPVTNTLAYDAIRGVLFGLSDQFTSFISPDAAKLIEEDATGSFSGVGAFVQLNKQRALEISKIIPGSPAEQQGLKAGDLIIEVDGKSIVGDDLSAQVAKVRGPEGSKVTLTIVREGVDKSFKVDVVREKIEIKLVDSKMLDSGIAYVALTRFDSATTADQLNAALKDLLAKNPKGLIFDLRGNPGGFLDQAIDVANTFLPDGVVLYERTKDGKETVFRSDNQGIAQDIPMVVLIDGGSASASEIVAGAIQDRGRGKLIGEKSFGKGSVQQINHLSDGSQLRVTIAHWFTPNNRAIHGQGLEPDITVAAGTDPSKDPQLDRAVQYLLTGQ